MYSASKPWWQQMTALVSLSASGTITGFSFVPRAAADLSKPSSVPIRLLALDRSVRPVQPAPADDAIFRSAIVKVAHYYLRMAAGQTPAEMEAIIWQQDSLDGADHGESCAAFASLTLELGAQVAGQQSWVAGGTSYPWPLHQWVDARVDPNPASPGITSVLQDAEAHGRWHPLGDGYEPLPGDWVLFSGHVEVVTNYAGGVLSTIGGDSLPNYSVNAHEYPGPLSDQGVVGFVDNGQRPAAASTGRPGTSKPATGVRHARGNSGAGQTAIPGASLVSSPPQAASAASDEAAIPGAPGPASGPAATAPDLAGQAGGPVPGPARSRPGSTAAAMTGSGGAGTADVPGPSLAGAVSTPVRMQDGAAAIPGLPRSAQRRAAAGTGSAGPRRVPAGQPPGGQAPAAPGGIAQTAVTPAPAQDATAQQAFISQVAPGAIAAQRRYGVPASVTIAQAIDESGWGQSILASRDDNLFGIKGTGPAGSDAQPTQEYENSQWVTGTAPFRVYHSVAESIEDHGRLLATSGYYTQAMADRHDPDAFAAALTGVYATDPDYGSKLVSLMQEYDLYRYDAAPPAARARPATPGRAAIPGLQQAPLAAPTMSTAPPAPAASASPASAPASRAPAPPPAPTSAPAPTQPAASPAPATSAPGPATPPAAVSGASRSAAAAPSTPAPAAAPSAGGTGAPAPSGPAAGSARRRQSRAAYRPAAQAMPSIPTASAVRVPVSGGHQSRRPAVRPGRDRARRYQDSIPPSVRNAFLTSAVVPLTRAEALYRDVASHAGIRWEYLAACDWMQCEARPRYSPVQGEKLGTVNPDGTIYRTKSAALEQCADDLVELAWAVYQIDLTARAELSVRDLANVFAAFRWGGLLKLHRTSAMEFPYSVAGLTAQHVNMRWPKIDDPNTPDKPGARFRMPFGAVPVMLGLNFPVTA